MVYGIYYYKKIRISLRNFLQQKGIRVSKMIKDIAKNPERYYERDYIPIDKEKTTINLTGDAEDFLRIKKLAGDCAVGAVLGKCIYNYMWVHKDDEPRKIKGKRVVSVYFSEDEYKKLIEDAKGENVSRYIKSVLGV